jgi:RNA polymerase sigma-70 factor (ECF subfamily)
MSLQAKKEVCAPEASEPDSILETILAGERTRLVHFCAHLTGNQDAAEDLAQETLLEAWRNQQKLYHQDESLQKEIWSKWLRGIARHVCMRWARRHGRDLAHLAPFHQQEDEPELDIEDLVTDDDDVEFELERNELAQLLDRALALLPPVTRTVLIERYIHDSPHAEIAGRLGLREDALVQRLYRGKLALRRVITMQMREEAAAYGFSEPEEEQLEQETHIWCPLCGNGRLIKYSDPSTKRLSFTCSTCWQIASATHPHLWGGVTSPRSILARQLAWLGDYYWQAIQQGVVPCYICGQPSHATICTSVDIPQEYYKLGGRSSHGVYIRCPTCHNEDINTLSHLTLDTSIVRQFWRKHPRMLWLPEHEIVYDGQPALQSSFQSMTDSAQLDMILQRDTLQVLSTHEETR